MEMVRGRILLPLMADYYGGIVVSAGVHLEAGALSVGGRRRIWGHFATRKSGAGALRRAGGIADDPARSAWDLRVEPLAAGRISSRQANGAGCSRRMDSPVPLAVRVPPSRSTVLCRISAGARRGHLKAAERRQQASDTCPIHS